MFLIVALVLVAAYFADVLYQRHSLAQRRKFFEEKYGCRPPRFVLPKPWWDQYGLLFMRDVVRAAGEFKTLEFNRKLLVERDPEGRGFSSYANVTKFGTTKTLFTDDVSNVKSAVIRSEDFVVEPARLEFLEALLGRGIFIKDGAHWSQSRKMLRPQFEKSQIADLAQFERHMPNLMMNIPDDGSTVDLQGLFLRFTMDTSTEFLTGTSTHSLSTDEHASQAKEFVANFEKSMDHCNSHMRLGKLYYLLPRSAAKQSHALCRKFVENWVDNAIKLKHEGVEKAENGKEYCFLPEILKHEEVDRQRAVDETMNILMAGRDTTASLLSQLFFFLARNPSVWKTLQDEIAAELNGKIPSYEQLRSMKYLRYCSQEALRLRGPVTTLTKHASKDTFLPRGGGADGLSPLFMAKGDILTYSLSSLHRSAAIYGADADVFRPERWADPNLRPGWNYTPFGGGQRVCLGQQYALVETGFVTVRLLQEYKRIEARGGDWEERITTTLGCRDGVKVALFRE